MKDLFVSDSHSALHEVGGRTIWLQPIENKLAVPPHNDAITIHALTFNKTIRNYPSEMERNERVVRT